MCVSIYVYVCVCVCVVDPGWCTLIVLGGGVLLPLAPPPPALANHQSTAELKVILHMIHASTQGKGERQWLQALLQHARDVPIGVNGACTTERER